MDLGVGDQDPHRPGQKITKEGFDAAESGVSLFITIAENKKKNIVV